MTNNDIIIASGVSFLIALLLTVAVRSYRTSRGPEQGCPGGVSGVGGGSMGSGQTDTREGGDND